VPILQKGHTTVKCTWWCNHCRAKKHSVRLPIYHFGSFHKTVWLLPVKKIWQPCKGATLSLSLARRAMERGHLHDSALTYLPGGYARHLKSRELSITDGSPVESGVVEDHYETPHVHFRRRHPPSWNGPTNNSVNLAVTVSAVLDVSAPV